MMDGMKGKRVLVTGAGGFIGSHLVERLARGGARVRALVHYNSRGDAGLLRLIPPGLLSRVDVLAVDLREAQAVQSAMQGCSHVFHLGALISIPYSYRHPGDAAEVNFMGTLNILLAARENKVRRLIHTSTSEVYGTARQVPIPESHPLQAQSPYAASKIGADKLAESFYCTYDLPVVTVRPFNTYGPRQSARAVIPAIISQVLARNVISLGSLETIRDFTYIDDTVSGLLAAVDANGVEGQVFNLGTGEAIRIGDLVEKIIHKTGRKVTIRKERARMRPEKSEVQRLVSDNASARSHLGWNPQVNLDAGLDRTIEWISAHPEFFDPDRYQF